MNSSSFYHWKSRTYVIDTLDSGVIEIPLPHRFRMVTCWKVGLGTFENYVQGSWSPNGLKWKCQYHTQFSCDMKLIISARWLANLKCVWHFSSSFLKLIWISFELAKLVFQFLIRPPSIWYIYICVCVGGKGRFSCWA